MKALPLALLFTTLIFTAPAAAQLVVTEADPAPGASAVALQTEIRFTFSEEVAVTNDWNSVIRVEPRDSILIDRVLLLVDDEGTPRIVIFKAEHTADTDFSWMVHGVQTFEGDDMAEPFVLRYTTASESGTRRVSGTVMAPSPAKQGIAPNILPDSGLRELARMLDGRGTPAFRPAEASMHKTASGAMGEAGLLAAENRTEILLLNAFSARPDAWDVAAATVIYGRTGSYAIEFVRPGIYTPVAVHYTNGVIDAVGFVDEDADGKPDALNVGSQDRVDVNLTLQTFERQDASAFVARARAAYPESWGDRLVLIRDAFGADPSGRAYVWTYEFYDPDQNRVISVEVDPLLEQVSSRSAGGAYPAMTRIPNAFLRSEDAVAAARERGGEAFLASVPANDLVVGLEGGNQYWIFDNHPTGAFWRVHFTNARTAETFEAMIDMRDGSIFTHAEQMPRPDAFALAPNHPNPFSSATTFSFTLGEAGPVRLTVYDLLGRPVRRILDGEMLPAGPHRITWEPDGLAAGAYLYRLEAGGHKAARVLIRR